MLLPALLFPAMLHAQRDTLRVMTYNVLYYGDRPACQAPHDSLHGYLKTIVEYASPHILGLAKAESFPVFPGDKSGSAPEGFPDSILKYALNAAFPGRYAACPAFNKARAGDMQVLFYDQEKLVYVDTVCNYVQLNDFTTWKFYYNTPLLAAGYDTTFLFVNLNHTESGDDAGSAAVRTAQLNGCMNRLDTRLPVRPNLIAMGDFNFHTTREAGYQRLVNPPPGSIRFSDPPFYPDEDYDYPADWDAAPGSFARCLTTSTRTKGPNTCGALGGGKSWYDHILVAEGITGNVAGLRYLPHSYVTVGNDGRRAGKSIVDAPENTAAPWPVINALYRMSNKYPVMLSLEVTPGHNGIAAAGQAAPIVVANPVAERLCIKTPNGAGRLLITISDLAGRHVFSAAVGNDTEIAATGWPAGIYVLGIQTANEPTHYRLIQKL